eukprot:9480576-Pyramimonas_sp.AAC.1
MTLSFLGPKGAMQISGVHLDPSWSERDTRSNLHRLSRSLLPQCQALGIIMGDFNFHEHGESRLYLQPPAPKPTPSRLATVFDYLFPRYGEVEQIAYTHRAKIREQDTYARHDRIYTNIVIPTLLDYKPHSGVIWEVTARHEPSDHVPVFLSMTAPRAATGSRLNIPTWVARHP